MPVRDATLFWILVVHLAGLQSVQAFMWQSDMIGIAKFVNACLQKMDPSFRRRTSDQPGVTERDVI